MDYENSLRLADRPIEPDVAAAARKHKLRLRKRPLSQRNGVLMSGTHPLSQVGDDLSPPGRHSSAEPSGPATPSVLAAGNHLGNLSYTAPSSEQLSVPTESCGKGAAPEVQPKGILPFELGVPGGAPSDCELPAVGLNPNPPAMLPPPEPPGAPADALSCPECSPTKETTAAVSKEPRASRPLENIEASLAEADPEFHETGFDYYDGEDDDTWAIEDPHYTQDHVFGATSPEDPICDASTGRTPGENGVKSDASAPLNTGAPDGCPICGRDLEPFGILQRQVHLNTCLDRPVRESAATPATLLRDATARSEVPCSCCGSELAGLAPTERRAHIAGCSETKTGAAPDAAALRSGGTGDEQEDSHRDAVGSEFEDDGDDFESTVSIRQKVAAPRTEKHGSRGGPSNGSGSAVTSALGGLLRTGGRKQHAVAKVPRKNSARAEEKEAIELAMALSESLRQSGTASSSSLWSSHDAVVGIGCGDSSRSVNEDGIGSLEAELKVLDKEMAKLKRRRDGVARRLEESKRQCHIMVPVGAPLELGVASSVALVFPPSAVPAVAQADGSVARFGATVDGTGLGNDARSTLSVATGRGASLWSLGTTNGNINRWKYSSQEPHNNVDEAERHEGDTSPDMVPRAQHAESEVHGETCVDYSSEPEGEGDETNGPLTQLMLAAEDDDKKASSTFDGIHDSEVESALLLSPPLAPSLAALLPAPPVCLGQFFPRWRENVAFTFEPSRTVEDLRGALAALRARQTSAQQEQAMQQRELDDSCGDADDDYTRSTLDGEVKSLEYFKSVVQAALAHRVSDSVGNCLETPFGATQAEGSPGGAICKDGDIVCSGDSFDVGYCSQLPGPEHTADSSKWMSAGFEVVDVDDGSPDKCARTVPEAALYCIAPRTSQELSNHLDCESSVVGEACATEGEVESEGCLDLTQCGSKPDDEPNDKVENLMDPLRDEVTIPDAKQQGSSSSQFLTRLLEMDSAAQEQSQLSAMGTFEGSGADVEERSNNSDIDERSCSEYENEHEDDKYFFEDSATDCGLCLEGERAAAHQLGRTGAREAIEFQVRLSGLVPLLELWALLFLMQRSLPPCILRAAVGVRVHPVPRRPVRGLPAFQAPRSRAPPAAASRRGGRAARPQCPAGPPRHARRRLPLPGPDQRRWWWRRRGRRRPRRRRRRGRWWRSSG